jgi:PTH1 family peptidyl-tRNA hydrolase
MIVIHDDVDISWGSIRIKQGGGAGGHKGIGSIIDILEFDDFLRVRMGIGRPCDDMETSDYVLAPLENDIWAETVDVIEKGAMAVRTVITQGSIHAMNHYNRREKSDSI